MADAGLLHATFIADKCQAEYKLRLEATFKMVFFKFNIFFSKLVSKVIYRLMRPTHDLLNLSEERYLLICLN